MSVDFSPEVSGVLAEAAHAAYEALLKAQATRSSAELTETVAMGADGTPTMRVDQLVEGPVLDVLATHGVNVLSEEVGLVDHGSARTLVIDPLDGSANAAAGVPLTAFSATIADEGEFVEALTVWLDTGHWWWARRDGASIVSDRSGRRPLATTGRTWLEGAAVSLLRPHTAREHPARAWWSTASTAGRIRILSTSCLEIGLVTAGATDAFADAASDTHRLVDIAAGVVLAGAAGGAMIDAFGRPIVLDTDLTKRWSGICAATPALAEQLATTITC